MDTGTAAERTATTRDDLIAQRLRTGSLVLAAVLAMNGVLDFATRAGGLTPLAWIYGAHFALVVLVQIATRRPHGRPRPLAALAVVGWNALFASYAALSPTEIQALVAPSIVTMLAAALLLPWGVGPQTIVATVSVLTYVLAFGVSGRAPDLGSLSALMSLLGAAAVSCIGAYVVEQHARTIDRQTEDLRAMNRAMREAAIKKDEFLASVSHELRTPLNVVLGYVDLLLDHSFGVLEPAQRDILHRITKNASNLSHLINDLIDLSRIEAGRLKVEVGIVELAPLFADLSGVMEVLLAGHDVAFTANLPPSCARVSADPDRLKQIVSNLLVNAVKFTERGSIALAAEPCADGSVRISVTDTGIGIPPGAQQAIFEPFRQVHDRSRRVPGAGIGLSISSRLAHLMGGSLEVTSEPERGSRFTLTVPSAAAGATPGAPVDDLLRKVS